MQFRNWMPISKLDANFKTVTQSINIQNAQRNFDIAQIFKTCVTYHTLPSTCTVQTPSCRMVYFVHIKYMHTPHTHTYTH